MPSNIRYIVVSTILTCGLLAWIEHGLEINYVIKTAWKISLFFLTIFIYMKVFKNFRFRDVISTHTISKREWMRLSILGVSSAFIVLIAYLCLLPFLDMEAIKEDLTGRLGMTKQSFLFVGLYITFGNSFLEEYFFRGFIFFYLPRKWGYVYSPLLFSIYHIPMIILWFSPALIVLCFLGLWIIGLVFQKVNEKNKTIWASWIIHICADIMIILIGSTLFIERIS